MACVSATRAKQARCVQTSVTPQSRRMQVNMGGALTLYQYEICPFCNKIKALLDLLNVPYTTIEVNPLSKSELKGWSVDVGRDLPGDDASAAYARVPVLTRAPQHDQLNDSAAIVACIAEELQRPDATASDAQVRF